MSIFRRSEESGSPPRYAFSKRKNRWWMGLGILIFALFFFVTTAHFQSPRPTYFEYPLSDWPAETAPKIVNTGFVRPENLTIIAFVFFGRRNRVEMLRCYLERNMRENGGWLDEVQWVLNTDKEPDLLYLDEILKSSPDYKKIDLSKEGTGFEGYAHAWGHVERGKLYVKIDDDVVWFADDAIPRIVDLKLKHPEYLLVSGNIINSPLLGWVHYHLGALHPYFPEIIDVPDSKTLAELKDKPVSWRSTDHPFWTGPDDFTWPIDHGEDEKLWKHDPPYDGHRWLRLKNNADIHRTPAAEIEYKTWGNALHSWAIAAQEHYSFLENLEKGQLDLYKMDRVWSTDYDRLSINFMTLWGDDVLDNLPMTTVDEEYLTKVLPKKLGKSIGVEMSALAAHFTFGDQWRLEKTDLLKRYHSYAEENACKRNVPGPSPRARHA